MSAAESSPSPPKEPSPAAKAPARTVPAEVREEIDKFCEGFVDALRGGLEQFADSSRERSVRTAGDAKRGGFEVLAEAVRRIHAEESVEAVAKALVDTAVLFSSRALLLINKGKTLLGFHAAGDGAPIDLDTLQRLTFSIASASSLAHAIDTSDTVTTTGAAANLSPEAVETFQYSESDRVYVYPLRMRGKVLAVVLVDETGATPVEPAALEVLIATAEAWIEVIASRRKIANAA